MFTNHVPRALVAAWAHFLRVIDEESLMSSEPLSS